MNAKILTKILISGVAILSLSGCATIIHNKPAHFDIVSDPSSANVTITDIQTQHVIMENTTPFSINLEKKAKYFKGKTYSVKVSKDGFKDINFDIKPTVSGWYIGGNLVVGGLIGWLIVDPITGDMWVLEPEKHENVTTNEQIISIKLLSDLTDAQKAKMEKIQ